MTGNLPSPLILASRGSVLALWQANFVADKLRILGYPVDIKTWKTTGDVIQDRFLHEIGGKGLFIKELEDAMSNGHAHFAVHSLKDLPAKIPPNFQLAAVLKRHSHSDVIIFRSDIWSSLGINKGASLNDRTLKNLGPLTVATSSLRRKSILAGACPNIKTVPIRGNVDTRLKKLESENWHAIILAEASLERLNIQNAHAHRLESDWFIPCAGQGALAIEAPRHAGVMDVLSQLECRETRQAINIERSVLARLGGDCTMPFGCLVTRDQSRQGNLLARAVVSSNDGHTVYALQSIPDHTKDVESALENMVIQELRENGANRVLESLNISVRI